MSEFANVFIALIMAVTAIGTLKISVLRSGMWATLAILFSIGGLLPNIFVGLLVIFAVLLGAAPSVPLKGTAYFTKLDHGSAMIVPIVMVPVCYMVFSFIGAGPVNSLALASLVSLVLTLLIARPSLKKAIHETTRVSDRLGTSVIFPQIATIMGVLFLKAGLSDQIDLILAPVIKDSSIELKILSYYILMFVFSILMGNALAVFSLISTIIVLPLIQMGELHINYALLATGALLSGYCGTLLSPIAANFNIVPRDLLEIEDRYAIIKKQIPQAAAILGFAIFYVIAAYKIGSLDLDVIR